VECERFAYAKNSHGERRAAVAQPTTPDPGASFGACLGAVLRRLRSLHDLTQAGLGRLAGYDGSYIGAVERAAVRPSRDLVERCDRVLDAGGALVALWPLAAGEWAARTTLDTSSGPVRDGLEGPSGSARERPDGSFQPARAELDAAGAPHPGPGSTGPAQVPAPAPAASGTPGLPALDRLDAGCPDPADGPGRHSTPGAVFEAMELARRAEASDVGPGTLAGVERAVERLRRAAASTPPEALIPAVRAQRRYVGRLLEARMTLGRHRRLLAAAGWLSILLAQLLFDAGERDAAEANRDAALRLADQAGHAELAAWASEALAWWALVDGRYQDALDLARAGQDLAPPASAAALQLALDEAQAWTALGDRQQAAGARRQADLTRAMLPGAGLPPAIPDDEPTLAAAAGRGLAGATAP